MVSEVTSASRYSTRPFPMTKTWCHLAQQPYNLSTNQPRILTWALLPVFTPHRLSHHTPPCQGSHAALLHLQKAAVVKYLLAFSGFLKPWWESAVVLSSRQLQSAAPFRRDWESNAAHLLSELDMLYPWLRIWGISLRSQPPPTFSLKCHGGVGVCV